MHVRVLQKKCIYWKCGPQIRLCLFTFRPIASKQLNSRTTIDTLSWLGGAVVTHPLSVQEVPGSIPGSGKGFCLIFSIVVVVFLLFVQKHLIFTKFCNSFFNIYLFSILNILTDLWPIIKVQRYRPSIFKLWQTCVNIIMQNAYLKVIIPRLWKREGDIEMACPSVRPFVRPSVRPSFRPSVTCVFSVTSQ